MDANMILTLIVAIVAFGVAIIAIARSDHPVTVHTVAEQVTDTLTDIEVAAGAAREWVLAAEQLWESGQLERDERFGFVLTQLEKIYPQMDADTLEGSIEAAVKWMELVGVEGA